MFSQYPGAAGVAGGRSGGIQGLRLGLAVGVAEFRGVEGGRKFCPTDNLCAPLTRGRPIRWITEVEVYPLQSLLLSFQNT